MNTQNYFDKSLASSVKSSYSPILPYYASDANMDTALLSSAILHSYENNLNSSFIPLTSIDIAAAFRQLQAKSKKLENDCRECSENNDKLKHEKENLRRSYKQSEEGMLDTGFSSVSELMNMKRIMENECQKLRVKLATLEESIHTLDKQKTISDMNDVYTSEISDDKFNNLISIPVTSKNDNELDITSTINISKDPVVSKRIQKVMKEIEDWRKMIAVKEVMISNRKEILMQTNLQVDKSHVIFEELKNNNLVGHNYFLNHKINRPSPSSILSSDEIKQQIALKHSQLRESIDLDRRTQSKITNLERCMERLICINNSILEMLIKRASTRSESNSNSCNISKSKLKAKNEYSRGLANPAVVRLTKARDFMQKRQCNYRKKYKLEGKRTFNHPSQQSTSQDNKVCSPYSQNLSHTSDSPINNKRKTPKKKQNAPVLARTFSQSVLELIREQQSRDADAKAKAKGKVKGKVNLNRKQDGEYEELLSSLKSLDNRHDESNDNVSIQQQRFMSPQASVSRLRQKHANGMLMPRGSTSEAAASSRELQSRCGGGSEAEVTPLQQIPWAAFIPPLATEGTEYNSIANKSMRLSEVRHMHSPFTV